MNSAGDPPRRAVAGADNEGRAVERAVISAHGLTATVLSWGAVLQDLRLNGVEHPLVLGFPDFRDYPAHSPDFGAVVGRVANRIRMAEADIGGVRRVFDANCLGRHTLHGGAMGTGRSTWSIDRIAPDAVHLSLRLAGGYMGFPGALDIAAAYRIAPGPALVFEAEARSDAPTICNLAHHSYFNLDGGGDARRQRLQIAAEAYLPVDGDLCPTGERRPTADTPFDFRAERVIGESGFDHNFCLAETRGPLRPVARLTGARSGVAMAIETTEPGLQLYDGSTIPADGPPGLDGVAYGPCSGVALEPQAWPDAPNQPWAGQVRLDPGETYRQRSVFRFS
ncbi:MAG: aldose epimerase family protein [Pseudomonadota bacterium]